jgi:hypothetical protein
VLRILDLGHAILIIISPRTTARLKMYDFQTKESFKFGRTEQEVLSAIKGEPWRRKGGGRREKGGS